MHKHPAVALIYTILFIVLLMIAVSVSWFTAMSDIRLSQKNQYSVQAYDLARAAIDDGWVRYKAEVGSTNVVSKTFPSDACGATSMVQRFNPNKPVTDDNPETVELQTMLDLSQSLVEIYDLRYCWIAEQEVIEGIGYYQGNKITLKAAVTHNDTCDEYDAININNCIRWDHSKDYLTIHQTGPSQ